MYPEKNMARPQQNWGLLTLLTRWASIWIMPNTASPKSEPPCGRAVYTSVRATILGHPPQKTAPGGIKFRRGYSYMATLDGWQEYSETYQHYNDVIMGSMASQVTSLTIVYSTVYSGADQRKHQSSTSLAFVRGINRGPVNSPHKWPVTRKMFPLMTSLWGRKSPFRSFVQVLPQNGSNVIPFLLWIQKSCADAAFIN